MTRLLYLHVVGSDTADGSEGFAVEMQKHLVAAVSEETRIDLISLAADRPRHIDFHAYEGLILTDIIRHVRAGAGAYDGFVIGCFYDIGLREARELSGRAVVTAPCQAATDMAMQLGNRFSVIVGMPKNIPKMSENVRIYGRDHAMASMRALGLSVWEQQTSPDVVPRMLEVGRACVEQDGAEVLVLGCTAGFGLHETLSAELGVPVLDAMLAPTKYAEFLADAARRQGWYPSRAGGSAPPPEQEIRRWGLFDAAPELGIRIVDPRPTPEPQFYMPDREKRDT